MPAPPRETLEDLRRVLRRLEARRRPRPAPEAVEKVLGGELLDTDAGSVVIVRHAYPLSHRHGRLALAAALSAPGRLPALITPLADGPLDPARLLFLDTETTGLAGGTGTYAFLVGAGYVEGDRFVVVQYFMRDLDEEPGLLAALAPLLERAQGVVTFNGTGFDLPLLETRFVLARRRWPAALFHLDLLRPSRRVWTPTLEDCRLTTLERCVLGHEREGDVPSALIPSLYFDFLRSRRAGPLTGVLAHNRHDVLSLVALLGWFADAVERRGSIALTPAERAGLGRLWERVDAAEGVAWYREALAAGLAGPFAHWVRLRLAWWEKRSARWEAACALWEEAARADLFDPRPWEELAKFHEHRRRDLAAARTVVVSALDLARGAGLSARVVEAFRYRLSRLERRLAASGAGSGPLALRGRLPR